MPFIVVRKRAIITGMICAALCLAVGILAAHWVQESVIASVSSRKVPVYSVDTEQKVISLTFNCAWGNEDIPRLLNILEEHQVKATFFVLGEWCDKYPESVRAIAQAGHEVQSHSDTHPDMAAISRNENLKQIRRSADKIEAITGVRPNMLRPPSGSYNDALMEVLEQENFYGIQWSADSIDWKNPSPRQMLDRILAKAGNGGILLFHSGAANTPQAIPLVIEALQKQGYRFVTVGEMVYPLKESYVDRLGVQHLNKQGSGRSNMH